MLFFNTKTKNYLYTYLQETEQIQRLQITKHNVQFQHLHVKHKNQNKQDIKTLVTDLKLMQTLASSSHRRQNNNLTARINSGLQAPFIIHVLKFTRPATKGGHL